MKSSFYNGKRDLPTRRLLLILIWFSYSFSKRSAYYISKELYAKAIQSSQRVLKNTPNSLKALYRCGLANLRAGNLQEAAVHIGKAMDYAPDGEFERRKRGEFVLQLLAFSSGSPTFLPRSLFLFLSIDLLSRCKDQGARRGTGGDNREIRCREEERHSQKLKESLQVLGTCIIFNPSIFIIEQLSNRKDI